MPEEGDVAAEPEDPTTELLRKVLAGSRGPDVSRVKLTKMPALMGSRGLRWAKAWQDWFMHDQTEDVGQHDGAREEGFGTAGGSVAARRTGPTQPAHEICFNIDDKMLPYLLGVDLSSGCAILRELHEEILASTAEHTAALHERFAKASTTEFVLSYMALATTWIVKNLRRNTRGLTVPGAEGCDQLVDDDGEATLWMQRDTELETAFVKNEQHHDPRV